MLSDAQKERITQIFQLYDANKNHLIEAVDIDIIAQRFRKSYQIQVGSEIDRRFKAVFGQFWRKLVLLYDENDDRNISLDEFFAAYEVHLSSQDRYDEMIRPFIDNIFPIVDTDEDGMLNLEEYTRFYCLFHDDAAAAAASFQMIDGNQNGKLSQLEVYAFFHEFHFGH
jgi:Ca2+-binding EF-hand superfamily protein